MYSLDLNVHCEKCAYSRFCETKELNGENNSVLHTLFSLPPTTYFLTQLLKLRSNCEDLSSIFDLSSAVQIYVPYIYIHLFVLPGYITNSQYDQLPVGLIAQLVEHCTGIEEVMGSNPVQA